jgi:hypothetical protein
VLEDDRRAKSESAKPRAFPLAVPCGNHAFNEKLVCKCGVSWWEHQVLPRPCPLDARGHNRRAQGFA